MPADICFGIGILLSTFRHERDRDYNATVICETAMCVDICSDTWLGRCHLRVFFKHDRNTPCRRTRYALALSAHAKVEVCLDMCFDMCLAVLKAQCAGAVGRGFRRLVEGDFNGEAAEDRGSPRPDWSEIGCRESQPQRLAIVHSCGAFAKQSGAAIGEDPYDDGSSASSVELCGDPDVNQT